VPNAKTGHTVIQPEGRGILPFYYIKPETHNWRDGGHCENLRDEVYRMQNILRIFEVGSPSWRCRSRTLLHLGHLGWCMLSWRREDAIKKPPGCTQSALESDQPQRCC
jgi:hypothetical protein